MPRLRVVLLVLIAAVTSCVNPPPRGLALRLLQAPGFRWVERSTPGFRAHFLADSYPAAHQDSLLALAAAAEHHALHLLGEQSFDPTIDIFFVENRPQMEALLGRRATGLAEPASGTVLLMTNPEWRAFERHEIMHVIATRLWGPPASPGAWVNEGLAQFADGRCAGHTNQEVAARLTGGDWYPFEVLTSDFRSLADLDSYLQAASLVAYLYQEGGPDLVRRVWTGGPAQVPPGMVAQWQSAMSRIRTGPDADQLALIRDRGCG